MQISLAKAEDTVELSAIASRAFMATYSEYNTPEDMAEHLRSRLSQASFLEQLGEPDIKTYLARDEGYHLKDWVGYFQLKSGDWSDPPRSNTVEVLTFYLQPDAIGKGLGAALMKQCKLLATELGYSDLWLGVWGKNIRAIKFYQRMGFKQVGTKSFLLGADLQSDWVMEQGLTG